MIPDFCLKLGIGRRYGCGWRELPHQDVHLLLGWRHPSLLVLVWEVLVALEVTIESTNDRLNKE